MSEQNPEKHASSPQKQEVLEQLLTFDSSHLSDKAEYILAAAIQKFARKGYRATSVRDIVELADVTNPMLYYYFDDKAGIFHAAVDLIFSDQIEAVVDILESDDTFVNKIQRVVTDYLTRSRQKPVAAKFIYSILLSPIESSPPMDITKVHASPEERTAELFNETAQGGLITPRSKVDGEFFSAQLYGVITGHLQSTLTKWQHLESKDARRQILDESLNETYAERLTDFVLAGTLEHYAETKQDD